ncbi:hypothetical protein JCM6882_002279 [Rhodosporidiobolus microsporus]
MTSLSHLCLSQGTETRSSHAPTEYSASTRSEEHAPTGFLGGWRNKVLKLATAGSEPTRHAKEPKDGKRPERPNMLGASSRGAGVKPKRSATTHEIPLAEEAAMRREMEGPHAAGAVAPMGPYGLAGPSRGGFIVQTHAKAVPTVATTTSDSTSLSDLPPLRLPPTVGQKPPVTSPARPPVDRAVSVDVFPSSPPRDIHLGDSVLPPSTILVRLADVTRADGLANPLSFVPLLRLLAKSVGLFPFPPPALAASTLSEALAAHPASPGSVADSHGAATPAPTPSPAQIYLSQSHHLVASSPSPLRTAMLDLMVACINASLESTGGMRETEKAIFWDEARRWAEEARVEVDDGQGGKRWVLPDADREALVSVLNAMTRGGRDLSDVPGLVALLCTFVTEALPFPRPPSPLFDPHVATPFTRSIPHKPSPHASSLALLTALHKFSAPHIYTASTLMALRAGLEVAKLREEQDLGGRDGVLDFLGAVVRFGEVTGGRAARRKAFLETSMSRERDEMSDPDEILREVVSTVARLIGCEGLVSVVELKEGQTLKDVDTSPSSSAVKTSILPPLALDLMRDLIRSPANQATKSLRSTLVAPPPNSDASTRPRTPVLLLVGALRSLRKAMAEHSAELEASSESMGGPGALSGLTAGESRWPSMLSLGLPFLWNGIRRVMLWESAPVDAEVLRLVEERLSSCEKAEKRMKELAAAGGGGGGAAPQPAVPGGGGAQRTTLLQELEDFNRKGVQYEEWEMAVEVLDRAKKHVGVWEQQNLRQWLLADEASEAGPVKNGEPAERPTDQDSSDEEPSRDVSHQFTQRPGVLVAFVSLLRKVIRAWRQDADFTGSSSSVFNLLVSLAPHLSEGYAQIVLDQCEAGGLCLPSHPEWLDRTQEIVKAFYVLPARNSNGRSLRRGVSSTVRRRVLQLITSLHAHLRHLPAPRQELVDTVIMPLLETSLESETDVGVAEVMVALVAELGRDVVDVVDHEEEGPIGVFDRLRLLLVKMAKTSNRTLNRQSFSTPTGTPKRSAGLASLSRVYSKEGSPTSSRILSPTLPAPIDPNEPREVSSIAAIGLISVFHLCLEHSTPTASEKAAIVFRDILSLFAPSLGADPEAPVEPSPVSIRTRLLILQWLVRLRADASHRVHWVRDVDITGPAKILNRFASPEVPTGATAADAGASAPVSARGSDEGHGETRGRSSRQVSGQAPADRSRSASRLRAQLENRSPSRAGSIRRSSAAPIAASPILWTVPEKLPFDFGESVAAVGSKALASFDHNRMRNWTEEEDPGTGLMKVVEAEETLPQSEWAVVLPVSEYLAAVNHVLQTDQEWELVSYILCHLPEQLSNKHLPCGPRCAQQIHSLRKILCDGLRYGDRGERVFPRTLPAGIKRAEVHAVAYHCLTALISYRSLFSKPHQDEIIATFMHGLNNPRDTAKPCIHALSIATFELRPSMTKHLAEVVRELQKIISSATLGVHILEFIAGVGQEPAVYANFTDVDFQTVFGIALKYIQAHNDRLTDDPAAFEAEEGIEYAFSQYVLLLAYYNIAIWFLALRLSERPKFVPFLTRRLVQANEAKPEVDEATEVMFDMIARYAYSNADPRPRPSEFDDIIVGAPSVSLPPPKTWIVGHATVTIRKLQAPAWVEVTVRRPSGVVKMLWEMQNISMTTSAPESDLIAAHLRHRGTNGLMHDVAPAISNALASLPAHRPQPHIGHRARRASFSGTSSVRPLEAAVEENAVSDAINSAARDVATLTLESGVLTVDPSFFAVQLSSFPVQAPHQRPVLVPNEPGMQRGVTMLDTIPIVDFHKVGVLYAGPGQTHEKDILANTHGSKAYVELISRLGALVRLKGSRADNIYTGGLDQENDIDGKWTYVWDDDISQIVFHVATLMPTNLETDPQCTLKKRHIGNDFIKVIFNDSGGEFAFDTLPGDFNFVNIVIQPHTPAGNPWIGPGMSNNTEFFKVSMQCRPGMPEVGPLGTFKMVTGASLPSLVRQLALHSNIFAQTFLASVGFETGRPAGTSGKTHKIEYSSNWRKRLQQIKQLRQRILVQQQQQGGGGGGAAADASTAPLGGPLDLQEAEAARLFTSWV